VVLAGCSLAEPRTANRVGGVDRRVYRQARGSDTTFASDSSSAAAKYSSALAR